MLTEYGIYCFGKDLWSVGRANYDSGVQKKSPFSVKFDRRKPPFGQIRFKR